MVSGNLYADNVSFGGLTAKNCTFISVTSASGFSSSDSEGLMGMGFSTISSSGSPTYFENLMALMCAIPLYSVTVYCHSAGDLGERLSEQIDNGRLYNMIGREERTQRWC